MTQPVWLLKGVVLAVHDMQLAEHGGPAGVRDDAVLLVAGERAQRSAGASPPAISAKPETVSGSVSP